MSIVSENSTPKTPLIATEHSLDAYLSSTDNKSSDISRLIRKHSDDKNWLGKLEDRMKFFADGRGHDFNLFSLLMCNWNCVSSDEDTKFLVEKFDAFGILSLFKRLYAILNDNDKSSYHHVCFKIIAYFFHGLGMEYMQLETALALINDTTNLTNKRFKSGIMQLVIVHLPTDYNDQYVSVRDNILKTHCISDDNTTSVCNVSYNEIVKHHDSMFFELLFCLKESRFADFKNKFRDFIASQKMYLGDYWMRSLLLPVQLLNQVTIMQNLHGVRQFLFDHVPDVRIGWEFLSSLQVLEEFDAILEHHKMLNFVNDDLIWYDNEKCCVDIHVFRKLFKNTPLTRKLLFGRLDYNSESLFEIIISKSGYNDDDEEELLNYIWTEFELFALPELFVHVSCVLSLCGICFLF